MCVRERGDREKEIDKWLQKSTRPDQEPRLKNLMFQHIFVSGSDTPQIYTDIK